MVDMLINSGTKALAVAAPFIAKQVPKLWPLLLESKNREKLADVAKDLASKSPTRKLHGQIELTALQADTFGNSADSAGERELAHRWAKKARHLKIQLDMPMVDRKTAKAHKASIRQQLGELQADINAHLQE